MVLWRTMMNSILLGLLDVIAGGKRSATPGAVRATAAGLDVVHISGEVTLFIPVRQKTTLYTGSGRFNEYI